MHLFGQPFVAAGDAAESLAGDAADAAISTNLLNVQSIEDADSDLEDALADNAAADIAESAAGANADAQCCSLAANFCGELRCSVAG